MVHIIKMQKPTAFIDCDEFEQRERERERD